jgi:phosphoribosyl-dephospho-CoA transferase
MSQTDDQVSWNMLRTTMQSYFSYKEALLQSKSTILQVSSILQKLMYPPHKEKVRYYSTHPLFVLIDIRGRKLTVATALLENVEKLGVLWNLEVAKRTWINLLRIFLILTYCYEPLL